MEIVALVVGAAISLVSVLFSVLFNELVGQRRRRREQMNELYRRVAGEFIGRSIALRYEYEHVASLRRRDDATRIPDSMREADAAVACAYNELSLMASSEAFDSATQLRRRLEEMRNWLTAADRSELTDAAARTRAQEIWVLRNRFVERVRDELGLVGRLKWDDKPTG